MSSGKHSHGQREGAVLGVRILCHPELARIGEVAVLLDHRRSARVAINRKEPCFIGADGRATRPLSSARVSRRGVTIEQYADGSLAVCSESDQVWLDERPVPERQRLSAAQLEQGVTLRLGSYVLLWLGKIIVEPDFSRVHELRGQSRCMRELRGEILRVADLPISVLLRGETGVGKELVATALHRCSPRAKGPIISVNMAAVPAPMAASELFGHVKGAFTGAGAARRGYFAEAHHGTLFLDEIGETASDVQPMLLRALEQGVIQPLGGKPEQVDVRVIAATDSNLEAAVSAGRFKAPLLRRFGYEIHVPPLRARREDIADLFIAFLRQELEALGEGARLTDESAGALPFLPADFLARLVAHPWPGNVRELRNVTRRFAVHNRGRARASVSPELIRQLDVSSPESAESAPLAATEPAAPGRRPASQLSDEEIARALHKNAYMVDPTAAELGVSRSWLHKHLNERPNFRKAKDLTAQEIQAALGQNDGDLERAAMALGVSRYGLRLRLSQRPGEP